ncbi:MAG: hypothetical protein ACO3RT_00575 [Arenicellales bacterium]
MTGELSLERLQLGFANAETLQDKTGIPAIIFGLLQAGVLLFIYQRIRKRERGQGGDAAASP